MAERIKENQLKALVFMVLFTLLILQTMLAGAQSNPANYQKTYSGFVASFGTRSIAISCELERINQSRWSMVHGPWLKYLGYGPLTMDHRPKEKPSRSGYDTAP